MAGASQRGSQPREAPFFLRHVVVGSPENREKHWVRGAFMDVGSKRSVNSTGGVCGICMEFFCNKNTCSTTHQSVVKGQPVGCLRKAT